MLVRRAAAVACESCVEEVDDDEMDEKEEEEEDDKDETDEFWECGRARVRCVGCRAPTGREENDEDEDEDVEDEEEDEDGVGEKRVRRDGCALCVSTRVLPSVACAIFERVCVCICEGRARGLRNERVDSVTASRAVCASRCAVAK